MMKAWRAGRLAAFLPVPPGARECGNPSAPGWLPPRWLEELPGLLVTALREAGPGRLALLAVGLAGLAWLALRSS